MGVNKTCSACRSTVFPTNISTMSGSLVLPGVRLCPSDPVHLPGHGTYTQHGYIYSSLMGELRLITRPDNTVTVGVEGSASDTVVPAQQDIVTVRVLSVNPRFAKVHILSWRRWSCPNHSEG